MSELSVEHGFLPEDKAVQKKVQKLFRNSWRRLRRIPGSDQMRLRKTIEGLLDELSYLRIELPCHGVEYHGLIVDRDAEVDENISPAPFKEWAKSLGVAPDLFGKSEER